MMSGGRFRGLFRIVKEALISVGLVFSFFLGLQALLNAVFPSDAGLGALIAGMRSWEGREAVSGAGRRLSSQGLGGDETPVATLSGIHNQVKTRKGTSLAWGNARRGMSLYHRDAVQTYSRSAASIHFAETGRLDLSANTHVVIRSSQGDIFASHARSSILVVDGELRGRIASVGRTPAELEVELPHGATRVATRGWSGEEVAFRIRVNEDSTSSIAVDRGELEVTAGRDTVRVRESEYTTVGAERVAPPAVLDPPVPVRSPADGAVFSFGKLSPRISFEWEADPAFSAYRLVIARDAAFQDVVHDEMLEEPRAVYGDLVPGTYHWKVAGIRNGFPVTRERIRTIHLSQTVDPPKLVTWWPEGVVEGDSFVLRGRTDPGIRIVVEAEDAEVDARGHFNHRVALEPGLNVVVVEAVDAIGNVTYESRVVNSKPGH